MSNESFLVASCEHCGQHIEFPSSGIGLRVSCPHCALETNLIEDLLISSVVETEEITAAELKDALSENLPRPRISVLYQVGLFVVAVFMVLLPVVYLAFASASAYGTYWYATHAWVLLSSGTGAFTW